MHFVALDTAKLWFVPIFAHWVNGFVPKRGVYCSYLLLLYPDCIVAL